MSKSLRPTPSHHPEAAVAGLSAPSSTGSAAHSAGDLGPDTVTWLAAELGIPIYMVVKVLESDPTLIEGMKGLHPELTGATSPEGTAPPADGPNPHSDAPAAPAAASTPEQSARSRIVDVTVPDTARGQDTLVPVATPRESSETSQQTRSRIVQIEPPNSRLFVPEARPLCCQIPGSQSVRTPGGFTIEFAQYDIRIYNAQDDQITRIWGDPHVNENGGGDDWHFGNDSTFILPDGVKLCLDTRETSPGVWLVQGADVIGGNDRFHFGVGDEAGLHKDGKEWDKSHEDAALDDSAGVFAMMADGTWAMRAPDGHFYDVQDESWGDYLSSGDVTFDESKRMDINGQQQHASLHDTLPDWVSEPHKGEWEEMPPDQDPRTRMTIRQPSRRPPFAKYTDSQLIETPLGYTIEMRGAEVFIWSLQGKPVTRIWGDPHVNESGKKDDMWHFGEKSTFILPDGTKIALKTKQNGNGLWFVTAVDIVQSHTRFHYGAGDEAGMTEDGREWDEANTDRSNASDAGVFALTPSGEWAVMGKDGHFYDVKGEAWADYLKDPDVDLDPKRRVQITRQQNFASKTDFLPAGMQMAFIGESHPSEAPTNEKEAEAARQALLTVMSPTHLAIIEAEAPKILPGLAADLVLARFVGDMPVATLRHLVIHAPQLILDPGEKSAPPGAIWPRPEVVGRSASEAAAPWWAA